MSSQELDSNFGIAEVKFQQIADPYQPEKNFVAEVRVNGLPGYGDGSSRTEAYAGALGDALGMGPIRVDEFTKDYNPNTDEVYLLLVVERGSDSVMLRRSFRLGQEKLEDTELGLVNEAVARLRDNKR